MRTNLSPLKWLLAAGILVLSTAGCASRDSKQSLTDAALQRIDQISSERQLELVEFEIRKFLKAQYKGAWYEIGKKKILLSCKAYLQAGIDLGDFNPMTDVVIDEERKSISLTLPCPTLLSMEMPLEEVEVADEKVTGFRSEFKMSEINTILRMGEEQILESVPSLGIIDEAKQKARLFFEPALKHLGFSSVYVSFKQPVKE